VAAHPPPIQETLRRLDRMAADYRDLCRTEPLGRTALGR